MPAWETFLKRWDRPTTLFYVDPPYWGTEHYYGRGLFERADHERLAAALNGLRGRFIMTINDLPETRALYRDWASVEPVSLSYSTGGSTGKKVGELIITGI